MVTCSNKTIRFSWRAWNLYGYAGSEPIGRVDPLGLKYTVVVEFKKLSDIPDDAFATTTPLIIPRGKDDIPELQDGCCWCAEVNDSRYSDLTIRLILPIDGFGTDFTFNGWLEILGHELRREEVYRKGYDAYLAPVPQLAKKCGNVCHPDQGVAKAALQKYVDGIIGLAKVSFESYTFLEQAGIEEENDHRGGVRIGDKVLFDRFIQHYNIVPPFPANWPPCPNLSCP